MQNTVKAVSEVVGVLIGQSAKRATKYLSDRLVVSGQRRGFKAYKGRPTRTTRDAQAEIVLKVGRPNYAERQFIRQCKQAGEPLPVKKVQIKHFA
jgi:hypothetical protein